MNSSERGAPDLMLLDSSVQGSPASECGERPLDNFVSLGLLQIVKEHAWRYRDVGVRTYDIDLIRKPFNKAVLLRLLSSRRCWFEDEAGNRLGIGALTLTSMFGRRLRAMVIGWWGRQCFLRRLKAIENPDSEPHRYGEGAAIYLRTDLVFGMMSGGSVTHIAGVLNQLQHQLGAVRFVTTDVIPTVSRDIETWLVRPDSRLADIPEQNALLLNEPFEQKVLQVLAGESPRFIYQRYSVNNIAGVLLARKLRVPLVLEYNGSEVWINRHWGRVLDDETLAVRLEQLNLAQANLIVVVSEVLAEELRQRGVPDASILVNPNGVDPDRYRPDVTAEELRRRYALEGFTVLGFIGSFGPWHGADILVRGFADLLEQRPTLRGRMKLLMIGDGQLMSTVQDEVKQAGLLGEVILTGRVPQAEGPAYLALCDILMSPHVPNPDGSAFFGSPTKLFEYMAMGRPIVASDLDQIGDILEHERTALLVPPGEPAAMASAVLRLLDDPQLADRLASNARRAALERHSWQRHTERILDALDELSDAPDR